MKIIRPFTVDDSSLTSTNVPADTTPVWSSVTAYVVGDTVRVESEHKLYECLINNTNQDPSTTPLNGSGNPYWLDLGATNRWSMFDGKSRKVTTNPESIVVEITPNQLYNSVAVLNIDGVTLNITVTDPAEGVVYSESIDTNDLSGLNDFYPWCFEEFTRVDDVVRTNLPAYNSSTIKVELLYTGNTAQIGELVIGNQKILGTTEYGVSVGIIDYSRKETDSFGNPIIVQRQFTDTVNYPVAVPTSKVFDVKQTLAEYRATPLVFVGNEDFPSTIVYGFIRNFDVGIQYPSKSEMTLEVEELS